MTILLDKYIFFILDFLVWYLECQKTLKHNIIKTEGLKRNEIDDIMWTKILIQMKGIKKGALLYYIRIIRIRINEIVIISMTNHETFS